MKWWVRTRESRAQARAASERVSEGARASTRRDRSCLSHGSSIVRLDAGGKRQVGRCRDGGHRYGETIHGITTLQVYQSSIGRDVMWHIQPCKTCSSKRRARDKESAWHRLDLT